MNEKNKIELSRAARNMIGASLRMVQAVGSFQGSALVLGRAALALGEQVVRPAVPLLDATAKMCDGVADAYEWCAERTSDVAALLVTAAERLQVERDAAGLPTFGEVQAELVAAETEISPPARILVRFTNDGAIESYSPETETRWSASGFGDPADGARVYLSVRKVGEDFAIERGSGNWQRAGLVEDPTLAGEPSASELN